MSQLGASGHPDALGSPALDSLPSLVLDRVAAALLPNAGDIVRLSSTCRSLQHLGNDEQTWEQWIVQRFGKTVLPPTLPTGPVKAIEVEGYWFYQGLQPGSDALRTLDCKSIPELTAAARQEPGVQAFTSDGRVFRDVGSRDRWTLFSLDPREGLYVACSEAQRIGLRKPPRPSVYASWPPAIHSLGLANLGLAHWVYFGGLQPGEGQLHFQTEKLLPQCNSLADLVQLAASKGCIAFATDGTAWKGQVPHMSWEQGVQPVWRRRQAWEQGVYVRADLVGSLGLPVRVGNFGLAERLDPAKRAAALSKLYARLNALALDASDMNAVWLDGHYLTLKRLPGRPSPVGLERMRPSDAVIHLNDVCWLDVSGEIPGVLPGVYQVAWCVQLESFHSGADVTLWAAVHGADRGSGGGDGSGTGGNSSGGGGGATNGRPSREVEVRYNTRQLKAIWSAARQGQQPAQARRTWCWVRGGVLHIDEGEAPAVVRLGWRSHNDWWKRGVCWAFAQLLPVGAAAAGDPQQVPLPQLPAAVQGQGAQEDEEPEDNDSSDMSSHDMRNHGRGGTGGVCRVQ